MERPLKEHPAVGEVDKLVAERNADAERKVAQASLRKAMVSIVLFLLVLVGGGLIMLPLKREVGEDFLRDANPTTVNKSAQFFLGILVVVFTVKKFWDTDVKSFRVKSLRLGCLTMHHESALLCAAIFATLIWYFHCMCVRLLWYSDLRADMGYKDVYINYIETGATFMQCVFMVLAVSLFVLQTAAKTELTITDRIQTYIRNLLCFDLLDMSKTSDFIAHSSSWTAAAMKVLSNSEAVSGRPRSLYLVNVESQGVTQETISAFTRQVAQYRAHVHHHARLEGGACKCVAKVRAQHDDSQGPVCVKVRGILGTERIHSFEHATAISLDLSVAWQSGSRFVLTNKVVFRRAALASLAKQLKATVCLSDTMLDQDDVPSQALLVSPSLGLVVVRIQALVEEQVVASTPATLTFKHTITNLHVSPSKLNVATAGLARRLADLHACLGTQCPVHVSEEAADDERQKNVISGKVKTVMEQQEEARHLLNLYWQVELVKLKMQWRELRRTARRGLTSLDVSASSRALDLDDTEAKVAAEIDADDDLRKVHESEKLEKEKGKAVRNRFKGMVQKLRQDKQSDDSNKRLYQQLRKDNQELVSRIKVVRGKLGLQDSKLVSKSAPQPNDVFTGFVIGLWLSPALAHLAEGLGLRCGTIRWEEGEPKFARAHAHVEEGEVKEEESESDDEGYMSNSDDDREKQVDEEMSGDIDNGQTPQDRDIQRAVRATATAISTATATATATATTTANAAFGDVPSLVEAVNVPSGTSEHDTVVTIHPSQTE